MEFAPRPWPSKGVIDRLVHKSGGYFIYASTVVKFIDEDFSPQERLDQVLDSAVPSLDSAPFAELDKLYLQILSSCPRSKIPSLKRILGFIIHPLDNDVDINVAEIEALLHLPHGQVKLMIR